MVKLGVTRLTGVLAIGPGWLKLNVPVGARAVVLIVLIGSKFSLYIVWCMVILSSRAELVTVLPEIRCVRLLIMPMLSVFNPQVLLG